jgi:hypothetical protein
VRRLRPYFQNHTIWVLTEYPPKKTLYKLDMSRRLVNWVVEFGEFDIEYLSRTSIKDRQCIKASDTCSQNNQSRLLLASNEQRFPRDSKELREMSKICQHFENSPEELFPISSPWCFTQWGINIVGPLPRNGV